MPVELLDYSYDRLTPAQIKAAGRAGVIRYVASGRPAVSATRAEVDGYRSSGLTFTAVWQNGKTRALGGSSAGAYDARDALTYCSSLGATSSDPVYFAVDFDAQPDQMTAVAEYFRGAAAVIGWPRVGAYGGLPVLDMLRTRTPCGLFWQTTSFSDGLVGGYVNLLQYAHDQTISGAQVDYDRALTTDYGQWDRMTLKSSARGTAPVIWVVLHTAEGATTVDNLRNFFADPNTQASCHAGADDTQLSDGWVPYDRAAWTLRGGNPISDNLEMCGFASWTRAQWLGHRGIIRNAARWAASRCQARGIPPRRLTTAQVAARNVPGILDHNTYTVATGDGTHWDVGPGFPWEVFLADVNTFMTGTGDEPMSAAEVATLTALINGLTAKVDAATKLVTVGDDSDDGKDPQTHPNNLQRIRSALEDPAKSQLLRNDAQQLAAVTSVDGALGKLTQALDAQVVATAGLMEHVAELAAAVARIAAAGPPAESGAVTSGDVAITGTVHVGPVPSGP